MKAARCFTLLLGVPLLLQQGASGQVCPPDVPPFPVGTAFTHKGFLVSTNPAGISSPVDDPCDFTFSLWYCQDEGSMIAGRTYLAKPVSTQELIDSIEKHTKG